MRNYILALLGLLTLLTSCSPRLTPFTSDLQETYNWSENDLQKIQFYLSDDIVLIRERGTEESNISRGKIKLKEGRNVEQIVFKKGTPGILLFMPKKNRFAISFEEGSDTNQFLMFGPSQKADGRYVLLAKKWNRDSGEVSYDNAKYTTPSSSAFASLLVDLKAARKTYYRTDRVGGRVVN